MEKEILILMAIFLLIIPTIYSAGDYNDESGTWKYSDEEQAARDALSQANPNANVPPESTVTQTADGFTIDQGPITIGGQTYGGVNIQLDSNGNIKNADSLNRPNGDEQTNLQNSEDTPDGYRFDNADRSTSTTPDGTTVIANGVTNGRYYDNGNYEFESIISLQHGTITIVNGVNVNFYNGELTASHADSFIRDQTISTNVDDLSSVPEYFSVEKADAVMSDGVTIKDIIDTAFKVSEGIIEIQPTEGITLNIEDSNYALTEFKALTNNSKLIIEGNTYSITEGMLSCEGIANESLTANNSAVAVIDPIYCFECITIEPIGTYYYYDTAKMKDFAVNVPINSSTYKLCIKKDESQLYNNYTGLIDFVNRKIELSSIVEYYRYFFTILSKLTKEYNLKSASLENVYTGRDTSNSLITQLDNDFIFINGFFINASSAPLVSLSHPNNYYAIEEKQIGNEIQRLVWINITKEELADSIIYSYNTGYFSHIITIKDNVLMQENKETNTSITILPPGHKKIAEFIE